MVKELDGQILTIVPSTVGKVEPDGTITINDDNGAPPYTGWERGTGADDEKSQCRKCHTDWSDTDTYFDKTWEQFTEVAGVDVTVACGACHNDGQLPPTSGAHAAHYADSNTDYTECEACHGDNSGSGYDSVLTGTHGDLSVTFASGVSHSANGAGPADDTCSRSQSGISPSTMA